MIDGSQIHGRLPGSRAAGPPGHPQIPAAITARPQRNIVVEEKQQPIRREARAILSGGTIHRRAEIDRVPPGIVPGRALADVDIATAISARAIGYEVEFQAVRRHREVTLPIRAVHLRAEIGRRAPRAISGGTSGHIEIIVAVPAGAHGGEIELQTIAGDGRTRIVGCAVDNRPEILHRAPVVLGRGPFEDPEVVLAISARAGRRFDVHFQSIRGETVDTFVRWVEERKSWLDVYRLAEGEIGVCDRHIETCPETKPKQGHYDHRNVKQLHLTPSFLPEGNRQYWNLICRSFCREDEFTIERQVDDVPPVGRCAEPRVERQPAIHDGGPPLHVGTSLGPLA